VLARDVLDGQNSEQVVIVVNVYRGGGVIKVASVLREWSKWPMQCGRD
jgi:hypothetical protein